jgi:hypothetical protein
LTSTDLGLIERIRSGEQIPMAEFTKGLDQISRDIVEYGGLFNYNKARLAGEDFTSRSGVSTTRSSGWVAPTNEYH